MGDIEGLGGPWGGSGEVLVRFWEVLGRFWGASGEVLGRLWGGSGEVLVRFCGGSGEVLVRHVNVNISLVSECKC